MILTVFMWRKEIRVTLFSWINGLKFMARISERKQLSGTPLPRFSVDLLVTLLIC